MPKDNKETKKPASSLTDSDFESFSEIPAEKDPKESENDAVVTGITEDEFEKEPELSTAKTTEKSLEEKIENSAPEPASTPEPVKRKRGRPRKSEQTTKPPVLVDQPRVVLTTPHHPAPTKAPMKKAAKAALDPLEKLRQQILKKAKLDKVPPIETLVPFKNGTLVKISDLALFEGKPRNPALAALQMECPLTNVVNPCAELDIRQLKKVAQDIFSAGRLLHACEVAKIKEGDLQVIGGRHRLAVLALFYGGKAEVRVIIEEMTPQEAREATISANQARKTKGREKAEHTVLKAVQGNDKARVEVMYASTVTTKAKVRSFVTYQVVIRGYPAELTFKVADDRGDGVLTTVKNLEGFWKGAVNWNKEMTFAEFKANVENAVAFINALVDEMKDAPKFDAKQHLGNRAMESLGGYYAELLETPKGNPLKMVKEIAVAFLGRSEEHTSELQSQR